MTSFLLVLALAAPTAALASDTVWRWTDAAGTVHYSNLEARIPGDAVPVETRIIREVDRLPDPARALAGGEVVDDGEADTGASLASAPVPRPARKRLRRIYDEDRLRFGCYAAGFLFNGGWAHADDISPVLSCDRYLYGVDGWLNAAKAELALRANGIDARDVYRRYRNEMAGANAGD